MLKKEAKTPDFGNYQTKVKRVNSLKNQTEQRAYVLTYIQKREKRQHQ